MDSYDTEAARLIEAFSLMIVASAGVCRDGEGREEWEAARKDATILLANSLRGARCVRVEPD